MSRRRVFRRRRSDTEVQNGFESYLEEEAVEYLTRGMALDEAQRQARIKLGNRQLVQEQVWQQNTAVAVEGACRDLGNTVRTLGRSPSFTLLAVLVWRWELASM